MNREEVRRDIVSKLSLGRPLQPKYKNNYAKKSVTEEEFNSIMRELISEGLIYGSEDPKYGMRYYITADGEAKYGMWNN